MRRLVVLAVCVVLGGVATSASDVTVALFGFASSMEHVNTLIEEYEVGVDQDLGEMHTGAGAELGMGLVSFLRTGRIGWGGRGVLARLSTRDASIRSSLIGVYVKAEQSFGRWVAGADVGAYWGAFSFPQARFVGLTGWGPGVTGSVAYRLPLLSHIAFGADVRLQWLPIVEMKDAEGQRYRGRGTPFLDFSGVSASIELTWEF
jgi:hypothetical protein